MVCCRRERRDHRIVFTRLIDARHAQALAPRERRPSLKVRANRHVKSTSKSLVAPNTKLFHEKTCHTLQDDTTMGARQTGCRLVWEVHWSASAGNAMRFTDGDGWVVVSLKTDPRTYPSRCVIRALALLGDIRREAPSRASWRSDVVPGASLARLSVGLSMRPDVDRHNGFHLVKLRSLAKAPRLAQQSSRHQSQQAGKQQEKWCTATQLLCFSHRASPHTVCLTGRRIINRNGSIVNVELRPDSHGRFDI